MLQLVVVFLEELRGATITLSNFGMIGGRFASLVVVPPQVAIVGAGCPHRGGTSGPTGGATGAAVVAKLEAKIERAFCLLLT